MEAKGIIGVKWAGMRAMEEAFCPEKCRCLNLNIRHLKYVGNGYTMAEMHFISGFSRGLLLNLAKYAPPLEKVLESSIHTPENP